MYGFRKPFTAAAFAGSPVWGIEQKTLLVSAQERLIAMTRSRGNLGFLMYVADSVSYLGLAALLIARGAFPAGPDFLQFFRTACWAIALLTCAFLGMGWAYFARTDRSALRARGGTR